MKGENIIPFRPSLLASFRNVALKVSDPPPFQGRSCYNEESIETPTQGEECSTPKQTLSIERDLPSSIHNDKARTMTQSAYNEGANERGQEEKKEEKIPPFFYDSPSTWNYFICFTIISSCLAGASEVAMTEGWLKQQREKKMGKKENTITSRLSHQTTSIKSTLNLFKSKRAF